MTEGDTDISKKIQDVIEREYPRTRVGTDGYLQAILCELIRARLSKRRPNGRTSRKHR